MPKLCGSAVDRGFWRAFCTPGSNPCGSIFKNKFSPVRVRVRMFAVFKIAETGSGLTPAWSVALYTNERGGRGGKGVVIGVRAWLCVGQIVGVEFIAGLVNSAVHVALSPLSSARRRRRRHLPGSSVVQLP